MYSHEMIEGFGVLEIMHFLKISIMMMMMMMMMMFSKDVAVRRFGYSHTKRFRPQQFLFFVFNDVKIHVFVYFL